jgi:hypothetical protein
MKYVILCLAMLCCFALGSPGRSAASAAPGAATDAPVETVETVETDGVEVEAYAGESCGGNVCGKGKYCCNASCGICVAYGMSCTQQAC